jgi:nucleoside-diphosphate-sugar epimerase
VSVIALTKRFAVFGANGFVGSEVCRLLEARGDVVHRITRSNWPEEGADLGNVIFTIGMTADFRKRLLETVETQVLRLHEALTRYKFESFTYLSSARVYGGAASTCEDAVLLVRPTEVDHVYNISKLAGESLCFAFSNPTLRVVRMSNVYGARDTSNLFLTAVMREALETGAVTIGQAPQSSKDYISVGAVADALVAITERGKHRIYNVAAGSNVTHANIAEILRAGGLRVTFRDEGPVVTIPPIDNSRFVEEFRVAPENPFASISHVLNELQQNRKAT